MASFFALVFGCCIRSHAQDSPVIDETSRLIPTTDPSNEQPRIVVVDHQKLKDRLGNIVRSKEGKMVNVSAQIPFNLHNHTLHPRFHPSTSRSTSLSNNAHNDHISTGHQPSTGRPPSPPHSAAPSLSRHNSTSRSSSGYRTLSQGDDLNGYERNPILNVRLVGASLVPGEGGGGNRFGRRGRKIGRITSPTLERDSGLNAPSTNDGPSILPTTPVTDRQPGDGEAVQVAVVGQELQYASEVTVPVDGLSRSPPIPSGGTTFQGDFVIHDAGDISRSWGD